MSGGSVGGKQEWENIRIIFPPATHKYKTRRTYPETLYGIAECDVIERSLPNAHLQFTDWTWKPTIAVIQFSLAAFVLEGKSPSMDSVGQRSRTRADSESFGFHTLYRANNQATTK